MNTSKLFHAFISLFSGLSIAGTAGATNISKEHADVFDVDYESGVLSLNIKTYTNMSSGVPLNTDDYSPVGNPFIVPLANTYSVPSSSAWSCLGAAGATVYRLKQSFVQNELWAGWNAQDVPMSTFVNDKVKVELVQVVSAPANAYFVIYSTSTAGTPTYLMNSRSGTCNDPNLDITVNSHVHGWWAFSAPGNYTLRFRASGQLSGGGSVSSATVDYQFNVQ